MDNKKLERIHSLIEGVFRIEECVLIKKEEM